MLVMPALRRLLQGDFNFEASLGYLTRTFLKINRQKHFKTIYSLEENICKPYI
jgi:hypothetical protein